MLHHWQRSLHGPPHTRPSSAHAVPFALVGSVGHIVGASVVPASTAHCQPLDVHVQLPAGLPKHAH
jgi:hypothetical protein